MWTTTDSQSEGPSFSVLLDSSDNLAELLRLVLLELDETSIGIVLCSVQTLSTFELPPSSCGCGGWSDDMLC